MRLQAQQTSKLAAERIPCGFDNPTTHGPLYSITHVTSLQTLYIASAHYVRDKSVPSGAAELWQLLLPARHQLFVSDGAL